MKQLPSLNGLRAISIFIVIFFHLFWFNFNVRQKSIYYIPFLNGELGVHVFFVISGFLITTLLLNEEKERGAISLKNFYIRRVLRIFPAYYFLLFVYYILQIVGLIGIPGRAWLTAFSYVKYINYSIDHFTAHAWSLSIEENFYLFWPFVFLMGDKARRYVVVFLMIIAPILRTFLFFHPVVWISDLSFFVRIDAIATGCFCALFKDRILAILNLNWSAVFISSLIILFIWRGLAHLTFGTSFVLIFVFLGMSTGTIPNIMIAMVVMFSVYGPKGIWYKLLNTRVLNYAGILSYSLYLWQVFIFKTGWWVTHFPQNLVFIFACALFSYYIIEKPFLRLKSRFAGKRKAPSPIRGSAIRV
ncbi:acyltransferase family protein [Dinghuibacter silviterrae]|uniref:Peptidoglycan/LPS O-acetylase OafA/YrhL n=1 Tax=Dinghuibacter silviterrae TaxID=1539049 RepID=A0A4R8DV64_9BACT|nr:acyltransferase [Dinghuibacter silviterrae]TDX01808.1 peptidoglycan/LPS O-acetylase OafA/YrhL [Dinghuibacter silviterrae]